MTTHDLKIFFALLFTFVFGHAAFAQSISGFIQNEDNSPIPFAEIFIEELQTGTTTDIDGRYFMTFDVGGEYSFIISSIGYETQKITVIIEEVEVQKNIWMKTSNIELNEIVVKASKRDPAYAIIEKVIANKKAYLSQVESFKTEVYVKAVEETDEKKKKSPVQKKEDETMSVFEKEDAALRKELSGISIIEMQVTLNYQSPNQYKEERTAYKKYGSKSGLFIPNFGETDFNFYQNMVKLTGIAEVPVISPISRTAILSYKYKLIESKEEKGQLVHKIKVIPRKSGNSTCSGFLFINEELWNINRLDLTFYKGGLRFFDAFRLKQNYEQLDDKLWIPYRQEFVYSTKQGKRKTFNGNTLLRYSDYQKNYAFPPKFFGNEIAITTKEAYKRDSTYWKASRPEALTLKEQKMIFMRDSIKAIRESKVYQDSLQAAYNKVQLLDLFWDGVGFRNYEKKEEVWIGPIPSLINFDIVGGFRLGPFGSYFRQWENGRRLRLNGGINVGIKNKDVQGEFDSWFRYNPHRLAGVGVEMGRSFYSINEFDAYLNQLKTSNYILHDHVGIRHKIELLNGLVLDITPTFHNRKSVADYDTETFIDDIIDDEDPPLDFQPYQAFITQSRLIYTPGQKYMTEPTRKVVLGSKYPTFSLTHRKGWKGVLLSDVNFDYVELFMGQDVTVGMLGNSKYAIKAGKYVNTKKLDDIDLKRFRQSDRYLYSNPLHSFQGLDTAFATTNIFLEAHWIHHFNGALINNVPLIKKTKVQVVAGGGFLWVKDTNFHHEELFAGLERTFKLGKRRRLRVGLYGVLAESTISQPNTSFKISLDVIDTWKKNWSF